MAVVLGIDLGISGARAAVFRDDGQLLGRGSVLAMQRFAGESRRERSVADWFQLVVETVRQAHAAAENCKIDCVGVGALGPCPVLIDDKLQPLTGAPLFSLDGGAEAFRQSLKEKHRIPDYLLGPDHVLPRLALWAAERPDAIRAARYVVDATGFLVAQLTGRAVMDHATTVDHCCAGLKQVVPLPEILKADAVAGGLTSAAARRLGLAAGTPVTVGTYDSFADLAGAGVLADGDRGLLLGSTVVIGRISKKPPTPAAAAKAGLRITPHAGEGSFVGGWTSTSGTALNWARVEFGQGTQHPQMPGASGLLALPYLAGERAPIWDIDARGALLGFTLETDKQHLATAMTEGVVLSILDIASRLDGLTSVASGYRVSGGGLRNKVWADAMADALGVPLEVMENAGEAIGPAALAFRALGVDRKARIARVIKPDRKRHARYQELLRIYRTLYPALKTAMHDLGRLAKEDQEHA